MNPYCCQQFAEHVERTSGEFERDQYGEWNIGGCCGGCYVVKKMAFCPFCGTKLEAASQSDTEEKFLMDVQVVSNSLKSEASAILRKLLGIREGESNGQVERLVECLVMAAVAETAAIRREATKAVSSSVNP